MDLSIAENNWDAIVVGSGAGGGMSAYVMAKAGLRVLVLEAGRNYDPVKETAMFQTGDQAPLGNASTPDKPFGYYDATVGGGWEVPGEPYTVAPGSSFRWYRTRMLGGRTNHWGRVSLRYGPYDFKGRSRDGFGTDWPVSYEDIEPWYVKTEQLVGVSGGQEQYENEPCSTAAQPGATRRASERLLEHVFGSMNIPVATSRAAILTRPLNDRPACFYATNCLRGCSIRANFQSPTVLLPPALATGNLKILTDCMVHEVQLDADGRASGVSYIDKKTGARQAVKGKVVVLAASSCESARILLNSKSARFPRGLSNDSGQVGRNLMDSIGTIAVGTVPALEGMPPRNDDGMSGSHIYVPWWGYGLQKQKKLDFPRGYHIELLANRIMPDMFFGNIADFCDTPFGPGLREEMRRKYGSVVLFSGRGEMLANENSFCRLDPSVKDQFGIPVLQFSWKWGDTELRQAAHMHETYDQFFKRAGGHVYYNDAKAITAGGEVIHEVGTTRMGSSPKNSVVNQYGQSWAVPNLFVTDGGVFTSSSHKNPTLTILALAMRSSDHLVSQFKKGAL